MKGQSSSKNNGCFDEAQQDQKLAHSRHVRRRSFDNLHIILDATSFGVAARFQSRFNDVIKLSSIITETSSRS